MANNRNCGCRNRGCSGCVALGSVAGPFSNCGRPACEQYYRNPPYYNGPCAPGPWPPKHCMPCCWPWPPMQPQSCAPAPEEVENCLPCALFTRNAPVDVVLPTTPQVETAALTSGIVPLGQTVGNSDYFRACPRGGVEILHGGTYLAVYSANIPVAQAVSTDLSLALSGTTLSGSTQTLTSATTDTAVTSVTGMAIFTAECGDLLTLRSSAAISISTPAVVQNVFTLTLIRVCPGSTC